MLVIDNIANLANTVINKLFPDKTQAEKDQLASQMQLATQEYNLVQSQLDINKIEAGNSNLFVSGWRPSIGWVCSVTYAANYIFIPVLINPILHLCNQPPIQSIPVGEITPVLMAMLGFGGLRTFERVKGAIPKGK